MFYVEQGAGVNDSGEYKITCPAGGTSLSWRYRVIRLWQMEAEKIWALGRPALLPLIGQTKISNPDKMLPKVVQSLKSVPDTEIQARLLTALVALMNDKEITEMVEKLIEEEELLMDTPYLRRIREEGREEGRKEGHEEGREEGLVTTFHQNILNALVLRFDPHVSEYQQVEKRLVTLTDPTRLEALFAAAIQSKSWADFQATLDEINQ